MSRSRVGSHYGGEPGHEYLDYQRRMGEQAARLDAWKFEPYVRADTRLIDFGCGTGALLERLPAADRIGIEPSDAARAEAAARGLQVVPSPDDLPDESADLVISNHALEHALSPYVELQQLRRILRPGGRLVIYTPIDDWRAQRRPRADPNHHLYTWTPLLMRNLLSEAGFELERCGVVTQAWPPKPDVLSRLPGPLLRVASRGWSFLRRRRQVGAVALRR